MLFRKKSLSDQTTYGIVGLGRFGYALAMELASTGADLIVLDKASCTPRRSGRPRRQGARRTW